MINAVKGFQKISWNCSCLPARIERLMQFFDLQLISQYAKKKKKIPLIPKRRLSDYITYIFPKLLKHTHHCIRTGSLCGR